MSSASAPPEGDPVTIGFTAAAAVLLAGAAVLVSAWLTSDFLRLLLGLVLAGYGVVVWRGAAVTDLDRPRPLGVPVERALGAAAALFGADLVAVAVVASVVGAASEEFSPPSPTLLIVIRFGLPLVALVAMAFSGLAAGPVGTGLVLPTAVAAVLAVHVPDAASLAVVMLVVAVLATLLALAPHDGPWPRFATVAGAVAASFAVGAGASPMIGLDVVAGQAGQPGTSAPGVHPVIPVLALAVSAVLLVIAVRRRDTAGGLVAALAFAAPPAGLVGIAGIAGIAGIVPVPGSAALLIVPAAVVVIALVAWAIGRLRVPLLLATVAVALVVCVVQALPVLGWPARVEGVVALVVFAGVVVLAWRLPGPPGAVPAGAVLVAVALAPPWSRLVAGDQPGAAGHVVAALVGVVAAGAAVWVLVRRHPRSGVIAAAAFCAAGTLAHSLFATGMAAGVSQPGWAALVEFGPLVVIGVVAAVFAVRGRLLAAAQAAGAVVLAAAGFAMVVLIALAAGLSIAPAQYGIEVVMAPLAPTSIPYPRVVGEGAGWLLAGVALLLVLAAVFATTLARRPAAPLAAAAALVAVIGAQCAGVLTLEGDPPIGLGPVTAIALGCGVACAGIAATAGRRFRHRRAEPAQPLPQE
ncbi:hypothetical protein [Labedaea rhizosphaerae]|uniref:Uncharacterized protein n=1 Tax=Labedaea rhizosphaerae TaxID=598644 RepID=A0A4R6SBH0_LABRH|nr:hypothetical protein [Labedaea rhizosphaerae]TDP97389.1 hypothetical protein EV186_103353 [Labedaea rhizosphaerae]